MNRDFYAKDTVVVARNLIGKKLVKIIDGIVLSGIIVETEAYCFKNDLASHARFNFPISPQNRTAPKQQKRPNQSQSA